MSERRPPLTDRDRALLVGLADGTLTARRRERAEARVRELPDAERLIARQRRVARALGAEPAPAAEAVRPSRRSSMGVRAGMAAALAAALAALLVVAPLGGGGTVERAADLAKLPATEAAPASTGATLAADVDGVRFPDWAAEFGWHATGMRDDVLDGRRTRTVFYEHEGHRIAYTIIAGPRLEPPEPARTIRRDGLELAVYHDPAHGGHDVAVFERGGRTCVLAGHVLEQSTLVKLAAWDAGGSLRAGARNTLAPPGLG